MYKPCRYCGRKHKFKKEACPALGKCCCNCNKKGHFSKQCQVPIVHSDDNECSDDEVFFVNAVKTSASQPALVTCTVNEQHKVVFEIDTGASCNILPFADYVKATGDKHGTHIKPTRTHLKMHDHTSAVPVGKVMLDVERGSKKHYLRFFIMKSKVMPMIGKSSCVGMKLVKILDCDTVHSVDTETKANTSGFLSTEQMMNDPILSQYIDVCNGLGVLPGEYTTQVKPDVVPVIKPPTQATSCAAKHSQS